MQPKAGIAWAQQVSGQETFGQVNSNKRITRHGSSMFPKTCVAKKNEYSSYTLCDKLHDSYTENPRIFVQTILAIVSTSKETFKG